MYILLQHQRGHFRIAFLGVFTLAAIGVAAFLNNMTDRTERRVWTVSLGATIVVCALAALRHPSDLFATPLLLLLAFSLAWKVGDITQPSRTTAAVVLLAAATFVRFGMVHGTSPGLGRAPDEKAVAYLARSFPPETRVAAGAPGPIWTARMTHVEMHVGLRGLANGADVAAWMRRERVRAIYADGFVQRFEPGLWAILRSAINQELTLAFESGRDADTVMVLVPKEPGGDVPATPAGNR
jgi:hypothetical protein